VVATLNQVTPYNWAALLRDRLDSKSPHAPLGGIENGGWKLVYSDQKNITMNASEKTSDAVDLSFSLGITLSKDGTITDAIPGSPAYAAGVGPGMKLIAVNGRKYSKDIVRTALKASVSSQQPIALLVENAEYYAVHQVDYHGGDRYPHLVRNEAQPDMLSEMIKSIQQSAVSNQP